MPFRSALYCFVSLFLACNAYPQNKKPVFKVMWNETVLVDIELLTDSNELPERYTAHFMAEVCSDDLCRPVDLYIDWDLLGNFTDYRTPADKPLTKFDHLEFSANDHKKLRFILSDKKSLLQDYEADELIDRSAKVYSEKTDAVTGATSPTFESAIVSGAVYTVHTLWRFVNGEAAVRIREYTLQHMSDTLLRKMVRSTYGPYLYFSLQYLADHQLAGKFADDLLLLIRFPDDFLPHMAIRQLPEERWQESTVQLQVLELLDQVDATVQNTLLNLFNTLGLSDEGISLLLEKLPSLGDKQAELAFRVLDKVYPRINGKHKELLMKLKGHSRRVIAAGADALLRKTG